MDDKKFDGLTKLFGSGSSRRTILKGLLGIGGATVTGTAAAGEVDARQVGGTRPTIPPPPPQTTTTTTTTAAPCPAGQGLCPNSTLCCPTGTCGREGTTAVCCASPDLRTTSGECCASPLQRCDTDCCPGDSICLTRVWPEGPHIEEETCCPYAQTCDEQCCEGTCYDPEGGVGPAQTGNPDFDRLCCPPEGTVCEGSEGTLCCEGATPQCCLRAGVAVCVAADACCTDEDCTAFADPANCLDGICNTTTGACETATVENCPVGSSCCPGGDNLCCSEGFECCLREGFPPVCIDPDIQCCTTADCLREPFDFDRGCVACPAQGPNAHTCVERNEGEVCGDGECTTCYQGQCVDDDAQCTLECDVCYQGQCIDDPDPAACPGECDECREGLCVDLNANCTGCEICVDGTCQDSDAGCDGCQTCYNGECVDDDAECPDICSTCYQGECIFDCREAETCCTGECETCNPDTGQCEDDQNQCEGDCDECYQGQCIDVNANCDGCEICYQGNCIDSDEGCDGCQTCYNGACVDDDAECPELCSTCYQGQCIFDCRDGSGCCLGDCEICNQDTGQCEDFEAACEGNCSVCYHGGCINACLGDAEGPFCCEIEAPTGQPQFICVENDECCPGQCGFCGECINGLCEDNNLFCSGCEVCYQGQCIDSTEGCGDCGVCYQGECRPDPANPCADSCESCEGTAEAGYNCTPVDPADPCIGESGICCPPEAGGTLTCVEAGTEENCVGCEPCVTDDLCMEAFCARNDSGTAFQCFIEPVECGECGVCYQGQCLQNTAFDCGNDTCTACVQSTNGNGEWTCQSVAEGASCGQCEICYQGECVEAPDFSNPAGLCGECGWCLLGECEESTASGLCEPCEVCEGEAATGFNCEFADAGTDPFNDCTTLCQVCDGSGGCVNVTSGTDPLNDCPGNGGTDICCPGETGAMVCQEGPFCGCDVPEDCGSCETCYFGQCIAVTNGDPCRGGAACEWCQAGLCVPNDAFCEDDNQCTTNICDPDSTDPLPNANGCVFPLVADLTVCDFDGEDDGVCCSGECEAGPACGECDTAADCDLLDPPDVQNCMENVCTISNGVGTCSSQSTCTGTGGVGNTCCPGATELDAGQCYDAATQCCDLDDCVTGLGFDAFCISCNTTTNTCEAENEDVLCDECTVCDEGNCDLDAPNVITLCDLVGTDDGICCSGVCQEGPACSGCDTSEECADDPQNCLIGVCNVVSGVGTCGTATTCTIGAATSCCVGETDQDAGVCYDPTTQCCFDIDCDDSNVCTTDTCPTAGGTCVNTPVADGPAPSPATGFCCAGEHRASGVCCDVDDCVALGYDESCVTCNASGACVEETDGDPCIGEAGICCPPENDPTGNLICVAAGTNDNCVDCAPCVPTNACFTANCEPVGITGFQCVQTPIPCGECGECLDTVNGTCSLDPDNTCTAVNQCETCQADLVITGTFSCQPNENAPCTDSDGIACTTGVCDDTGACIPTPDNELCLDCQRCDPATGCVFDCREGTNCCGECGTCGADGLCDENEAQCTGLCEECVAAGNVFNCEPIDDGLDPDDECGDCGVCNGSGQCREETEPDCPDCHGCSGTPATGFDCAADSQLVGETCGSLSDCLVCDDAGNCDETAPDETECGVEQICCLGNCVAGDTCACQTNDDCEDPLPICNTNTGVCVECVGAGDCALVPGMCVDCQGGVCVTVGVDNCPEERPCCDGICGAADADTSSCPICTTSSECCRGCCHYAPNWQGCPNGSPADQGTIGHCHVPDSSFHPDYPCVCYSSAECPGSTTCINIGQGPFGAGYCCPHGSADVCNVCIESGQPCDDEDDECCSGLSCQNDTCQPCIQNAVAWTVPGNNTCSDDSDCCSDDCQDAGTGNQDYCGCVPNSANADNSNDCCSGSRFNSQTCQCADNGDCAPGQVCNTDGSPNQCQDCPNTGEDCGDSDDCCDGLSCQSGTCQPCLGQGVECTSDGQCCSQSGDACNHRLGGGAPGGATQYCNCNPLNALCNGNGDCCDGLYCDDNGQCAPCLLDGQSCNNNSDCCSDDCDNDDDVCVGNGAFAASRTAEECSPDTCESLDRDCGIVEDDGCGNSLNCGTCTEFPNSVCDEVTGQCACTALDFCETGQCGDIDDGCGGTVPCGDCEAGQECVDNSCVDSEPTCQPRTACNQGECGIVSDGCDGQLDCGACTAFPNSYCDTATSTCACAPATCESLGAGCGTSINDGCGTDVYCGDCTTPPPPPGTCLPESARCVTDDQCCEGLCRGRGCGDRGQKICQADCVA
jgi:hypothetical protein